MIINSKFRDYYDPIVKTTGVDKSVVFERKQKTFTPSEAELIKFKDKKLRDLMPRFYFNFWSSKFTISFEPLIYCGTVFPRFVITEKFIYPHKYTLIYGFEPMKEWLAEHLKDDYWLQSRFSEAEEFCKKDFSDLCIEYKTPLILLKWEESGCFTVELNPKLKALHFQKIKTPVEVWQDIFAFCSGVLVTPHKVPRPISDKQKVGLHGFDTRTSFRKDTPPTRKQKK